MRVDTPYRRVCLLFAFALRLSILLPIVTSALLAQPRTYRIEPAGGSRFALEVFKTGLMSSKKHLLVFERYQGRLEYDAANPTQSRVELTIESASMVVRDDWVNEKERRKIGEEALNKKLEVKQHPEMTFRSGSIWAAEGAGRYEVEGELTIRGQTRPVVVRVTMQERDGVLHFEGAAAVKMKDYGMKPPSAALGLIGTKNEMAVSFDLRAVQAGP